jgi:mRNA interferase RelE/StbE
MAKYRIEFKPSVWKDLDNVSKTDRLRILRKIRDLANDPRPMGSQKLAGNDRYRIRQGDFRIIYLIEDERLLVVVVKVGHRREVYER